MAELSIPILVIIAIAINVPFGAWRATTERFSLRWFLAIHLPIPLILILRVASGHSYRLIPLMLASAVAGQLLGSWGYARVKSLRSDRAANAVPVPIAADEQPPERYR